MLVWDINGKLLEDVSESLNVVPLDFLQHFLALLVEILPDIEVALLVFLGFLGDHLHGAESIVAEPEHIVYVLVVDVRVSLLVSLGHFYLLDGELAPLVEAVVVKGPAIENPQLVSALLGLQNEVATRLPHSLLQEQQQVGGVLAGLNIDPLRLGLEDPILVAKDKPHSIYYNRSKKETHGPTMLALVTANVNRIRNNYLGIIYFIEMNHLE